MMSLLLITTLLGNIAEASASPRSSNRHRHDITVSQIYQFPTTDHWFENLAVRSDGKILATELTGAKLWQIDPFHACASTNATSTPQNNIRLIHEFPEYLGLLGVVEYRSDIFAFIAGNFSIAEGFKSTPGSYTIWSADFNCDEVRVEKIAAVPDAEFLNGMAYLSTDDALLMSDSELGVVWKLDLATKIPSIAISDPLMRKVNASAPDGVNGLKVYSNELWFTRGFDSLVAKTQITANGSAIGPATVFGTGLNSTWTMDDLVVNGAGQAYAVIPFQNLVARYDGYGALPVVVAGSLNSTQIAEPTSLAFARTRHGRVDQRTLYVATGGGIGSPINGNLTVGGQIVKIQLEM